MRRKNVRAWNILLFLVTLVCSLSAAALEFRMPVSQIPVGAAADIFGTTTSGLAAVISISGPASVPGKSVIAGGDGRFRAEIGPFPQAGEYTIAVSAGPERKTATLTVTPPSQSMDMEPGALGASLEEAANASAQALNAVKNDLEAIPGDDANLRKAKECVDEAIAAVADIRGKLRSFTAQERRLESMLLCEPNLNKEVFREYVQETQSTERSVREQTERMIQLGRESSAGRSDACVAVAIASSVLTAQKNLLSLMQNGLKTYVERWAFGADLGTGVKAAKWIQDRFLGGLRTIFPDSPEEQVASRSGAPAAPTMWDNVSGWSFVKLGLAELRLFLTGGGPWRMAATALGSAVDMAIDAYSKTHCLVFKGRLSGHCHVEALDNGRPMYELDNDWEGNVEIMAAKPSGKEPVSFRGYLTGRAKNFQVKNRLSILYEGKPGNFQYLSGRPKPFQQLTAVFVTLLEGTIADGKIAFKARKGGVDFDGRVVAQLAVVVIPTGSPVPLVQKYDTPYQPGWWQVTRALGDGGMATFAITMEGDNRVVKKEYSRELSAAGARGRFSLKVDLCSGCPTIPFL